MRWERHVARMGKIRNTLKVLLRKYERNRPLGRPRCRREHNTRMNIKEKGWESVEQIYVAQCRAGTSGGLL